MFISVKLESTGDFDRVRILYYTVERRKGGGGNMASLARQPLHSQRVWLHSYTVFVHESDFWDSSVSPMKLQNARKLCT